MLQDPNVERYVENAIKPLKKEIAKLKVQIEELNKALRIHDVSCRRELLLGLLNSISSSQFDNGDLHSIVDDYLAKQ